MTADAQHEPSSGPAPEVVDDPLAPAVVDAVVTHMNADHAADCLAICAVHGAPPWAASARMAGYDASGARFVVEDSTGSRRAEVVAPWVGELRTRSDVRHELVAMTEAGGN
jgi:hypothetical protein